MAHTPKYRRVYNAVVALIDNGTLKPGDRIPSTKQLCEEFECSSTAVNTAVILLADAGYIYGQPGMGRFVSQP